MAKTAYFQKLGTNISKEERLNMHIKLFESISNFTDSSIDDVTYENYKKILYEGQALSLFKSSIKILIKDLNKDIETDKNAFNDFYNILKDNVKQIIKLHETWKLKMRDLEEKKEEFLVQKRKEYTSNDPDPLDIPGQERPPPDCEYVTFELYVYHDLKEKDMEIFKWKRRKLFLTVCDAEVKKTIPQIENLMKQYSNKKEKKYTVQNNDEFVPKLKWDLDKVNLYEIIHSLYQLEAFSMPDSSRRPTKKYIKEAFEKFFMVDLKNLYSHTTHAKDRDQDEIFLDEMRKALDKHFTNLNEKRSVLK